MATVRVNGVAGFINQAGQFTPYQNQYPQNRGGQQNFTRYNGGNNVPMNRNNNFNQMRKKHSGAKSGVNKAGKMKGAINITFWNYSRGGGLLTGIATPYGGTHEVKSKSGRLWQNFMVSWFNKTTKAKGTVSGLYEPASGKLLISDWGWVVNPKAPNGGYAGRVGKK